MLSEDDLRDKILKYLYDDRNKNQWTTSAKVVIDLKKITPDVDRNQINRNIDFLIDEGFIKKTTEKVKSALSNRTMAFEKIRISSKGVQVFEKTKYVQKRFSSISLEGDNNVVVLGDNIGSITQTKGTSIDELNKLIELTKKSGLTEDEKMNLIGDIETIKTQLVKPNPAKQIIQSTWIAINAAATFSGAHDLLVKIKTLLAGWIH